MGDEVIDNRSHRISAAASDQWGDNPWKPYKEEPMANEIENRLRVLEEGYEYQDQTVETLNQVLIQQQAMISKLQEEVGKLREDLIAATLETEDIKDQPLPPHY